MMERFVDAVFAQEFGHSQPVVSMPQKRRRGRYASIKEKLQEDICAGRIKTKQNLLEHAASLGLMVTRNGRDYIGFSCPDGKRFRIRFKSADDSRQVKDANGSLADDATSVFLCGHWIYALTALSADGERKACYIGQTVNLKRRFRQHLRRHRPGVASFALKEWAARERVEVRATVLLWLDGGARAAAFMEAYWLKLAIEAGFDVPDVHKWGARARARPEQTIGQPTCWPVAEVFAASRSLSELVARGIIPNELFICRKDSTSSLKTQNVSTKISTKMLLVGKTVAPQ